MLRPSKDLLKLLNKERNKVPLSVLDDSFQCAAMVKQVSYIRSMFIYMYIFLRPSLRAWSVSSDGDGGSQTSVI